MEENQHIKKLLQRFRNNTISKSEFDELFGYVDKLNMEETIKNSIQQHWERINADVNNEALNSSQNDQLLDSILEKIHQKKSVRKPRVVAIKRMSKWYTVAATVLLFFGIGYFYNTNTDTNSSNSQTQSISNAPAEVITLKLDNGDIKIISEKESEQIINANGLVVGNHTGNSIAYTNNISEEKLLYNTLTVPYGKRFQVVLSDGTRVHLNAGTSLRYPIKFLNGLKREVFLDGEAYFDVIKDSKHPFLVNANDLNVKVLGTKFNVASYPENRLINTVLIEGSVEVDDDNNIRESLMLKPGYKASWDKKSSHIDIKKVDVEQHIAWMDGKLILNEVAFKDIQKKLERQYNVTFINNNELLKKRKFTARFDIENIDQVMKSLSISASFKYVFANNQIIIN